MPVDIVDAIPTFSVGGGDVQASGAASVAVPIATAIPTTCSPANNPVARLPLKLVARIEGLQFVEMTDLLPESWGSEQPTSDGQSFKPVTRRAVIGDIAIWAECYTLMASVLARKYPASAPDLFAYMRRVMRSARNFEGTGWVAYDRMYRRQALAQPNPAHRLLWAAEDATLYNEVFVGHARIVHRCVHCLSEHHISAVCPDTAVFCPPWQFQQQAQPQRQSAIETCRKFNENRCFVRQCKYRHACVMCDQPHPAAECPRLGQSGRSRSPSSWAGSRYVLTIVIMH